MVDMLETPTSPAEATIAPPTISVVDARGMAVPLDQVRPATMPGANLLGEVQGSGFAGSMWLVQIEGRFIQLTELLYRVMEFADGTRSPDQIATEVGKVSEWQMNGDDVLYLVANKLMPIGLVTLAATTETDSPPARRDAPSLLMLGLRKRAIGPDTIEPIARVLQYLFSPLALFPLLAAGIAAHGWLYLDRGVDGILSNVLYTPGLLLVVVLMSLLPGFWHEFGHASALRYGGGRARGIGVGIYIMDPAFYTDVTDSYRLGRWARIRTGMGGIYFDMILSTLLIVLYGFTHQEALLLLVVLSNLNTVYQFFPLVRLDGYWVLADLTGVPDFYSLMGAFVRSVVPIRAWRGAKLPPLKPWVKGFFALYTAVAFPGMLVFMFLMLRRVPGIATTAWDALRISGEQLPGAWQGGAWLTLAALTSQILLLSLTMLGLTVFLVRLTRTLLTLLWRLGVVLRSRAALALHGGHAA